jgi:hypothetical protein
MQTEIEKEAAYYFSDTYNLTKEQIRKDITGYHQTRDKLTHKEIRPYQVIGRGYKPQYARKLAFDWLDRQLKLQEYMLANFDEKNQRTPSQKEAMGVRND